MYWEGAELNIYINGEVHSLPLTGTQFAIVGKILGLQIAEAAITYYSDRTLAQFMDMKGNPLRLVPPQ